MTNWLSPRVGHLPQKRQQRQLADRGERCFRLVEEVEPARGESPLEQVEEALAVG